MRVSLPFPYVSLGEHQGASIPGQHTRNYRCYSQSRLAAVSATVWNTTRQSIKGPDGILPQIHLVIAVPQTFSLASWLLNLILVH